MHKTHRVICRSSATCWSATRGLRSVAIAFLCSALTGCVALTNPVGNGIPVRRLPPELLGESRAEKQPLTLSLLRQKPPDVYRLAAGDVLAEEAQGRSEEHTSELQSPDHLVCR